MAYRLLQRRCTVVSLLSGIALAITTTTGLGVGESWYDEQRVLLLIPLVGMALWACVQLEDQSAQARLGAALIGAVALAGAASTAMSERPAAGVYEWALLLLLTVLVWRGRCGSLDDLALACACFAALPAGAYSAGVVANLFSAAALGMPIGRDTFLVGFSNSRFPAQLQALTIPLMPLALAAVAHRGARTALSVAFALWWMCLLGSGSRTAWLALLLATLMIAALGGNGRRWLSIQSAHAAAGALLYVAVFYVVAPIIGVETAVEQGRLQDVGSVQARFALAGLALSMIAESPVLGVGPMHFAYADNGLGAHPHNFWLQLASEWGLPVAALAVAAVVYLFVQVLRAARAEAHGSATRLVHASLLASLTAWIVGTQFDGYMVVPTSQFASTVVLMLCVALVRGRDSREVNAVVRPHKRLAVYVPAAVAFFACAAMLTLPFTQFGRPTERELLWRQENPAAPFWPRFWQQGWIGAASDPTAR